ncbi:MAG: tRNA (cytidine(34)-2'-O)-methyltransferase, partial [Acidimicrobiia bacterium]
YKEFADVAVHSSFSEYLAKEQPGRLYAYTQRADRRYTDIAFVEGDALLFGKESTGLSKAVLDHPAVTDRLSIPIAENGRSLNLANAAAIAVYEAWRQNGFG